MKDQIEGFDNEKLPDDDNSHISEAKMIHLIEKADEIANKTSGIDFNKLARLQEKSTFDYVKFASITSLF